ncbi:flagellar filament capping protein FliD [Clostridium sp. SHJSY1]|uniref:flagellar filament capping protein FliD n=1 Tax=Clostridium sp. SHJSY1 TaxID=2942483 RepID=UPI002876955E|nr:flagellar filament capping protein FliD [Clostridium sp. SHJSY1]MDS0524117.1 flagellar filament capping protein FliD [Clostridium sp. SHJSY1]
MNINSTSSSSSSTNRITGLATGLDVDSMVKSGMQPYQTKVNKQIQEKEVLEIKQKLYRDLMSEGNKIFSKYLDINKTDSLVKSANYSSASFDSSNSGVVTAKGLGGAKVDNYTVKVTQLATGANTTVKLADIKSLTNGTDNANALKLTYGTKSVEVDISAATDDASLAKIVNTAIGSLNMKATYSEFTNAVTIETNTAGNDQTFTIETGILSGGSFTQLQSETKNNGTNLEAVITNSKDETITYGAGNRTSKTNSVAIDGVQFSFFSKSKETTTAGVKVVEETTITGKADVTAIKEKIVNFVNDYNAFVEKMNKLLNDKRDRSYQPLTADQKKEMSETEVKLWNEKVETGQLRRDNNISTIANKLKNSIIDPIEGSDLLLKNIGIKFSKDYGGNKDGTLIIEDDAALTEALQNNPQGVMDLFISSPEDSSNLSTTEQYNKSGIFIRMKDIINSEFISSGSSLSKKAGLSEGSTVVNNELSKSISKYETKIKEMQTDLTRREQALYSKYAKLETAMNKYNSQQAYLTSQFS